MRRSCLAAILTIAALPAAAQQPPASGLRRFALVVGANRGAADRTPLRYAVADADRFASLLTKMGGVQAPDSQVLREPTRQAFMDALAVTRTRAGAARAEGARTEVLLYFSGHADETGLMLGRERISYRELRQSISAIAADVGIAILDACASGAITRLKGGHPSPAFLTDESVQVQGYAFLTSSSENEAAQEAEHLKGSFFTHALLTGLRGAADVSGDGKVTLGEAYQFAFAETIAQTAVTQAGAQHPAYDIKLAGTGDVVMTDVREKPAGRRVELGLEPGQYQVYFVPENALMTGTVRLDEGQHQELKRETLAPTDRLPTSRRGADEEPPSQPVDDLTGRWRIAFQGAVTNTSVTTTPNETRVGGASGNMQFSHFIRRDLAIDFNIQAIDAGVVTTDTYTTTGTDTGFLVGARYHPPLAGSLRPHVGASIGAFTQSGTVSSNSSTVAGLDDTRFGGTVEGGVDIRIGGHFLFNVDGIVTMRDSRDTRFDIAIGFGFIFGSGKR